MKLVIVSAVSVADIAIVGWAWESAEEARGSRFGEEVDPTMHAWQQRSIHLCICKFRRNTYMCLKLKYSQFPLPFTLQNGNIICERVVINRNSSMDSSIEFENYSC